MSPTVSGTILNPREGIHQLIVGHVPAVDLLTVAEAQGQRRGWTKMGEGHFAGTEVVLSR